MDNPETPAMLGTEGQTIQCLKVWRYQRSYQKLFIKEGQTLQWQKVQKFTNHTQYWPPLLGYFLQEYITHVWLIGLYRWSLWW